jgi:hypothetical protein
VNGQRGFAIGGAAPRVKSVRRAGLLLLTIGALLYVGMQSRVAQSLPSRSPERLMTSFSDPVKVPPPEERGIDAGWVLAIVAGDVVPDPAAQPRREAPSSIPHLAEQRSTAHLLRAPPISL